MYAVRYLVYRSSQSCTKKSLHSLIGVWTLTAWRTERGCLLGIYSLGLDMLELQCEALLELEPRIGDSAFQDHWHLIAPDDALSGKGHGGNRQRKLKSPTEGILVYLTKAHVRELESIHILHLLKDVEARADSGLRDAILRATEVHQNWVCSNSEGFSGKLTHGSLRAIICACFIYGICSCFFSALLQLVCLAL